MSRLVDYFVVVGYDFDKQRELPCPAHSDWEFPAPRVKKPRETSVRNSPFSLILIPIKFLSFLTSTPVQRFFFDKHL